MQRRWRRGGPAPFTEEFGSVCAVFDPASGETHFLTELPSLLLSVIDDRAATLDTLVERLAGATALDPQARIQLLSAMEYLVAAELVESTVPEVD